MALAHAPSPTRTGYSVCTICDIGCQLRATSVDGRLTEIKRHDSPAVARNICYKGTVAPKIHNHEDRLRVPLKRVGARGFRPHDPASPVGIRPAARAKTPRNSAIFRCGLALPVNPPRRRRLVGGGDSLVRTRLR